MPNWQRLKWYFVLAIGATMSIASVVILWVHRDPKALAGIAFGLCCIAMAAHDLWPNIMEGRKPLDLAAIAARFPGPVTLRTPQRKLILFGMTTLLFGGSLIAIAFFDDVGTVETFFLALGGTLMIAAAPLFLISVLRGSTLRLDAEGLEIFQGLKRSKYFWRDASEFSVADAGVLSPGQYLMVVFDDARTSGGSVAGFNRSLLGRSGGLPDTYGMEPWGLAWLLNEWRTKAFESGALQNAAVNSPTT